MPVRVRAARAAHRATPTPGRERRLLSGIFRIYPRSATLLAFPAAAPDDWRRRFPGPGPLRRLAGLSGALSDAPQRPQASASQRRREPRPSASTLRTLQHALHVAARAIDFGISVEVHVFSVSHVDIVTRSRPN